MNETEAIREARPQGQCNNKSDTAGVKEFTSNQNPITASLRKSLSDKKWANELERHEIEQASQDLNDETVQKVLRILHLAGR